MFLKHLGLCALPMNCSGSLIVPEALEQAETVTLSFDFLYPSADFSNDAARVLVGNKRKHSPVSLQLKT